ncbi:hypothetical protein HYE07_00695 [Mycoplasmopsis bovis]|nr:hypothetical protein HYE07_00695 [Mycoplasmopsis bovis]
MGKEKEIKQILNKFKRDIRHKIKFFIKFLHLYINPIRIRIHF